MSTYDSAYTNRRPDNGKSVCSCKEEVNMFCEFHGKFGKGGFRNSKEHEELKELIRLENELE